jgi:hypothetical protein
MPTIADATDRSTVEQLIQVVEDLQETVTRQANRINDLETALANHKDHTGREFADVRARITNTETEIETVEDTVSDTDSNAGNGDNTGSETGVRNNDTPLETICSLPEYLAARELSANQERARFIGKDVRDYAEKCPAGLVIDSRAIKRVITAKEGTKPHTQTVARVMDFLEELGKDGIEQTKRRGRKLLAVDPDMADRLASADVGDHTRCDRESGPTRPEGVISSG